MSGSTRLVEIREAGEVRAAAVLASEGGKLDLLLPDGRHQRVPASRIIHHAGPLLPETPGKQGSPDEKALTAALLAFESEAHRRAAEVDLEALHELLTEELGEAAEVDLHGMAPLALGTGDPNARAALHRALASPNPWFRFAGKQWRVRTADEVEGELEKLEKARRLAEERSAFVAAARARLKGAEDELPAASDKFLRLLRDVAIQGDEASGRKEAGLLAGEILERPAGKLSGEIAFNLLVRLGVFEDDENLALLRAGVHVEFSQELLKEAEELAKIPLPEGREDLRELEIVTVDEPTTREVDDGLSLQKIRDGWRVGIHIADASHHVRPGSVTDDEALARSTTYYMPRRTIPMLPPSLSEGAASLSEGVDRPALSFLIDLTPHGELIGQRVVPSLIRVTRRLSYEDCERILESGAEGAGSDDSFGWLRQLRDLASQLEAERRAAGATPIRVPELTIEFDASGAPRPRLVDPGRPARQLISEMMILANRVAAATCAAAGVPAIYRRQAPPNGSVPLPPGDRYDAVAVNAFRRTLQRTEVVLEPGPHAGLGLPAYLQATSPIRRYQDLVVHRILKALHSGAPQPCAREELEQVARATEAAGRQARQLENERDQYWIYKSLEPRIDEVLEALVLRSDGRRTDAELVDFAFRTRVPAREGHEPGLRLRLRIRSASARRGSLTLEELGSESP